MIKLKQLLQENQTKVKTIFVDMDGVLCDFDTQYKKYLANDVVWDIILKSKKTVSQKKLDGLGIDRQTFNQKLTDIRNKALESGRDTFGPFKENAKKQLNVSVAWNVIGIGGEDFWSTMSWQPGGESLISFIKATGIHTEILTAGSGSSAKNGKQAWLRKNGLGDIPFNIVQAGIKKQEYASEGDLLIDDKQENNDLFIQAGGMAITHTDTPKTIQIMKKNFGIDIGL